MKEDPALHEGHRQRLKNQYLQNGLDSFADHQILELLLFFTIPRIDTNELAHNLLKQFGSLSAVLDASPDELQKLPGIGENSAFFLHLLPDLSRAYRKDKFFHAKQPMMTDDIGHFFVEHFTGVEHEQVTLMLLDSSGRMIGCETVYAGTPGSVPVDARKIMAVALSFQASAVVIAHNHPGGRLTPSDHDIETTRVLSKILFSVGLRLREHILVSGESWIPIKQLMENQYAIFVPTVKIEKLFPGALPYSAADEENDTWFVSNLPDGFLEEVDEP